MTVARYPDYLSDAQRTLLIRVVERAEKGGNGVRPKGAQLRSAEILRRRDLVRGVGELYPQIDGKALVDSWRCAACGHLAYHCPASGCNHYERRVGPSDPFVGDCDCEVFVSKAATEKGGKDR